MKKTLALVLSFLVLLTLVVGCAVDPATQAGASASPAQTPDASSAPEDTTEPEPTSEYPLQVAVVVKAQNEDFWQDLLIGANNYAKEYPSRVAVTVYGPETRGTGEDQATLLREVIKANPAAIVIAPEEDPAVTEMLEKARNFGIPIFTIESQVDMEILGGQVLMNDVAAGQQAAAALIEAMENAGLPLSGKVGVVSTEKVDYRAEKRITGLKMRLGEIAPDLELVETVYGESDEAKCQAAWETLKEEQGSDLVAAFGADAVSGAALGEFLATDAGEGITGVAFGAEDAELQAIRSGDLAALVTHNPYEMGYIALDIVFDYIANNADYLDIVYPEVVVVTSENLDDPLVAAALDPSLIERE